jgi:hypothetical protein
VTSLSIAYLLADTEISATTRAVLAQADALIARGHTVRIVTTASPTAWRSSRADWACVDEFTEYVPHDDFVIGTSWATLPAAHSLAGNRAIHLCVSVSDVRFAEASQRREIEAASSIAMPKLVASRSLLPAASRFSSDVTWLGTIVEDEFFRSGPTTHSDRPRVLLAGSVREHEDARLREAYGAAAHARWFHQKFDLVRVSPWSPSRDEPLDAVQEFHVALTAAEMPRLMHSCHALLATGFPREGSGQIVAEALAAGVPCIAPAIPAYTSLADPPDYALFAPENNPVELGERLIELLGDSDLADRLVTRGHQVAAQWRADAVSERLEQFLVSRLR